MVLTPSVVVLIVVIHYNHEKHFDYKYVCGVINLTYQKGVGYLFNTINSPIS